MDKLSETDITSYLKNRPNFLQEWLLTYRRLCPLDELELIQENASHKVGTKSEVRSDQFFTNEQFYHQMKSSNFTLLPTFRSLENLQTTKTKFESYISSMNKMKTSPSKNFEDFSNRNEKELFHELLRDAASELNTNVLCHKILQHISYLTNCDRGSLFLVQGTKDNRYLVSKLFNVTVHSTLEESLHNKGDEIIIPFGSGIVGTVAQTKQTINIKNAYQDHRFNKEVDQRTGYRTYSILCAPILNYEDDIVGVAQIVNKVGKKHEFNEEDQRLFKDYLKFCGVGLNNSQLFETSILEFKRNELMLNLTHGIFEEQSNIGRLITKIMVMGQELLHCERYLIYLIDEGEVDDKISRSFHGLIQEIQFAKCFCLRHDGNGQVKMTSYDDIEKSPLTEVAGHVVKSAKYINIIDLNREPYFKEMQFQGTEASSTEASNTEAPGTVKTVLCMPIEIFNKKIIGVTQLVNNLNGQHFSENDITLLETFSLFCGIGIHNCLMYEKAHLLMAKNTVALELLSYQASASYEESERIMIGEIPVADEIGLYDFDFDDSILSDNETCRGVVRIFKEFDLITKFRIPMNNFYQWICSVKKNYRPVAYHNWRHAFNVCQTMFCLIQTGKMKPFLSDIEILILLIACLCHDLDHRGTTNAFQIKVESPLAMLYTTSTMEHHHFDHCIMILMSEGNNILVNLDKEVYQDVIHMLQHAILATDLVVFLQNVENFKTTVQNGVVGFFEQKSLLRAVMMTASDLAATTKPWEKHRNIAELITSEYYEQGDLEKTALKIKPLDMMDREKQTELPLMQVTFMESVCLPLYKYLSFGWPAALPLYDGCCRNRDKWVTLSKRGTYVRVLNWKAGSTKHSSIDQSQLIDYGTKNTRKNFVSLRNLAMVSTFKNPRAQVMYSDIKIV